MDPHSALNALNVELDSTATEDLLCANRAGIVPYTHNVLSLSVPSKAMLTVKKYYLTVRGKLYHFSSLLFTDMVIRLTLHIRIKSMLNKE